MPSTFPTADDTTARRLSLVRLWRRRFHILQAKHISTRIASLGYPLLVNKAFLG